MAFTGSFSKTNDSATGYNYFRLADTSSYADEPKVDFSDRYFYIVKPDGTFIQSPEGTDKWNFSFADYPSDTRAVEVLTEDMAATINMIWVPVTPITDSTYFASTPYDFLDYSNEFKYELVLDMATERALVNIQNFYDGIMLLQALLSSSNRAIYNTDPYASQKCIEQIQYLQANPNLFY